MIKFEKLIFPVNESDPISNGINSPDLDENQVQ